MERIYCTRQQKTNLLENVKYFLGLNKFSNRDLHTALDIASDNGHESFLQVLRNSLK